MAHYKRKRPRTSGTHSPMNRREIDAPGRPKHWWLGAEPRWHDVVFHRRPRRREAAAVARAILVGGLDPDDAIWPHAKWPTTYYW